MCPLAVPQTPSYMKRSFSILSLCEVVYSGCFIAVELYNMWSLVPGFFIIAFFNGLSYHIHIISHTICQYVIYSED